MSVKLQYDRGWTTDYFINTLFKGDLNIFLTNAVKNITFYEVKGLRDFKLVTKITPTPVS